MRSIIFPFIVLAFFNVSLANSKSNDKQESPEEMKEIIAHSICLAEGYPNSQISTDAEGVVATYIEALGSRLPPKGIEKIRQLAKNAAPAKATSLDQRNFAIAKCVLFSHRSDVRKSLRK